MAQKVTSTDIKLALKEFHNGKPSYFITECKTCSTYFPDPQGATGVAVAWGHEARAKGCKGAHLILSDWKYVGARYSDGDYMDPYDKESWELTGAKMVVVDGEKIKEDTYYRCIEGEIVEVTEDGEIVEE